MTKNMINANSNTAADALSIIAETGDRDTIPFKHELKTARLFLRPVNETDLNDYVALLSDPAVMRFVGAEAGALPPIEEIEMLHGNAVLVWKSRGYGRWTIFDQETGEFIGFCGFRCEQGVPELIAAIHEKFWDRGITCEAAAACLDYGFKSLGFAEVKAFTRPNHRRARRVLDKLNADFTSFLDVRGVEGAAYVLMPDSIV